MSAATVLVGVHEPSTAPDALREVYPAARGAGPYYLGQVDPAAALHRMVTTLVPAWNAGLEPLWTLKPDPAAVAAGAWDAPCKAIRDYHLATGLVSRVFPWHEPEDNMDAATFTAMFNRLYPLLSCPPVLSCGYVANTWQWQATMPATTDPTAWRPAALDFYGANVYSGKGLSATLTVAEHPGLQRFWNTCASLAPLLITERGFAGGPQRVDVLAAEFDALAGLPLLGYQVWNALGKGDDPRWLLDPAAQLVVAGMLDRLARPRSPVPAPVPTTAPA